MCESSEVRGDDPLRRIRPIAVIPPVVVILGASCWWYIYLAELPFTVIATGLFEPTPQLQSMITPGPWTPASSTGAEAREIRSCSLELRFHVFRFQQERTSTEAPVTFCPATVRWRFRRSRVVFATIVGFAAVCGFGWLWWLGAQRLCARWARHRGD